MNAAAHGRLAASSTPDLALSLLNYISDINTPALFLHISLTPGAPRPGRAQTGVGVRGREAGRRDGRARERERDGSYQETYTHLSCLH